MKETRIIIDDSDSLFRAGCEYIGRCMESILKEMGCFEMVFDKRIFYTEGFNGFQVLESETGAFYIKRYDNDWLLQIALIADNRMVMFLKLSENDIRYGVSEFYAKGDDRSNPFKCFREFRLFRAMLKNLSPDSVIGTICVS